MSSIRTRKKAIIDPFANANNNFWAKDDDRFGVKMLKAMGWSPGKGLGVNEDGCVDAIKVRLKNDIKGVGYKETNDQWISHQDDFNALLSSLNGGKTFTDEECKLQNLEAKSKSSRNRVHYHKFARWKDLSSRSERDIASILGKRARKVEKSLISDNANDKSDLDLTESSMDMRQYFTMRKFAIEERKESMDESDVCLDSPPKLLKSKKMKLKKVTFGSVNIPFEYNDVMNGEDLIEPKYGQEIDDNTDIVSSSMKKKKKKHKKKHVEAETDQCNDSNDIGLDDCATVRLSEQQAEKKTKKKRNKSIESSDHCTDDIVEAEPEKKIKKNKKSYKKHKKRCHEELETDENIVNLKHKKRKSRNGEHDDKKTEVSITRLVESLKTISMFSDTSSSNENACS